MRDSPNNLIEVLACLVCLVVLTSLQCDIASFPWLPMGVVREYLRHRDLHVLVFGPQQKELRPRGSCLSDRPAAGHTCRMQALTCRSASRLRRLFYRSLCRVRVWLFAVKVAELENVSSNRATTLCKAFISSSRRSSKSRRLHSHLLPCDRLV